MIKRKIQDDNGYSSLLKGSSNVPHWKKEEVKRLFYHSEKTPKEMAAELGLGLSSIYDLLPLQYFYDVAKEYYGKESCSINNEAEFKILKKMKLKGFLPKMENSFTYSWNVRR